MIVIFDHFFLSNPDIAEGTTKTKFGELAAGLTQLTYKGIDSHKDTLYSLLFNSAKYFSEQGEEDTEQLAQAAAFLKNPIQSEMTKADLADTTADKDDEKVRAWKVKELKEKKKKKKEAEKLGGQGEKLWKSAGGWMESFAMFRRWVQETFSEGTKITSWGEKVKADLKEMQDHFENTQHIFKPILELDPSIPDECQRFLNKIRKANAIWVVYHQDSADHTYWKSRIQHMSKAERQGSREQQKFEEAQENLRLSKERLMNLYNYLDSNRDRVHNAALRACADVLSRIQPKWKTEHPPIAPFDHDPDVDDDVEPLEVQEDKAKESMDEEKKIPSNQRAKFLSLVNTILEQNTDFEGLASPEELYAKSQAQNLKPEQYQQWIMDEYEKELEEKTSGKTDQPLQGKSASDT